MVTVKILQYYSGDSIKIMTNDKIVQGVFSFQEVA